MPIIKGTKKTKAEQEIKFQKLLVKERADKKKNTKYCKKHERYLGGSNCIDCYHKRPARKEIEEE